MTQTTAAWSDLRGRCFLSHAFADAEGVADVAARVREAGAEPVIFELAEPNPDNPVSNDIVPTMLGCDCLVYLEGGRSGSSFWVAFEKDYALRSGLEVFAASPESGRLRRVDERPMPLSIHTVFHQADGERVDELFRWMREERHFDVRTTTLRLRFGAMSGKAAYALEEMLIDGGVALYLCGTRSVPTMLYFYGPPFEDYLDRSYDFRENFIARRREEIVDHVDEAAARALEDGDGFYAMEPYDYLVEVCARIDPALDASEWPFGFPLLDLYEGQKGMQPNWNRIDDLIIRLFAALLKYGHLVADDAP